MHSDRFPTALLVLGFSLLAGGVCGGDAPLFHTNDFDGSESCAPCHPRQYLEWRGSAHAYSLLDPIFRACSREASNQTRGEIGDHCIRCHSPIGTRSGDLGQVFDPAKLSPFIREGISCETCHRMEPPSKEGGPVADANFDLTPGRVFFGRLHRPQDNTAHGNETSEYLGKSESCGSCHDVILNGMQVESAFAEWAESPFAERGVQCQDCHMLRYSGQAAVGGPFREILRRHNFPGVSLPPPGFPNRGYQEEEVGAFLSTALRVSVHFPEAVRAGGVLPLTVTLKNSGSGHNFPSASFRQLWIEVTVLDREGRPVFLTGHLDANGDLEDCHSDLRPEADRHLATFSDYFTNEDDREVPYWFSSRVVERSLRSLEERSVPYRIPVPAGLEGSSLRLRVRVLFRAFRPYALRELGLEELAAKLPVWELYSMSSGPLPVVSTPPRKTRYRVPEDFEDLTRAFEALEDGDELIVGPGEYVIRRPLDFRGRRLHVRSAFGPRRTLIRYVPEVPFEERGSVVVFHGGEGPDSVLEGFGLEGGAGTRIEGSLRGGGIHVFGASPTIRGNRIAGCSASGGMGGGICSEEGAPAIEGNEIVSCWADRGGGLAYRGRAGSTAVLERNAFEGNLARQGGAVYLERGSDTRLEHCTLAGNVATEEGAAVFAADATALEVDHATVVYNRCGGSGSILRTGQDVFPPVTSSIIWANRPAKIRGDLSYCVVDFECPAFPGEVREFPLFVDPTGSWESIQDESDPGMRIPERLLLPGWSQPHRWVSGDYAILPASPALDAGDPRSPPDPDDTRSDIGAIFREQRLRGFIRGDVTGDGRVAWQDLGGLLAYLLEDLEPECLDAADVDDGGSVQVMDAVLLAMYLTVETPAPPAPFPECGIDPTSGDGVTCQQAPPPCRR